MTYTLIEQVGIMFLLSFIGYLMFKTRKISLEGNKLLGNILIYLSLPCVIINGFLLECTYDRIISLVLSSVLSLLVLFLSVLISRIFFRKNAVETFSAAFSNPGFFGIPLIIAGLSEDAVFYIAPFIAFLNLFQWTYGVSLMKKGAPKEPERTFASNIALHAGKLIKAPFMIAIIIGLFFFLSGITIPNPIGKCITYIASLNTPLAMFTIGIYLARTSLIKMFLKPRLYLVTLIRMIIIPLAAMNLLYFVPNMWLEMKLAILIASACPVGSNVAVYAQLHDNNYTYAVETVIISTFFSILTIPVIVSMANNFWG